MPKSLIIVDMQNDFISGTLKNDAADAIVPKIVNLIKEGDYDHIYVTLDTHDESYLHTQEGKMLPVRHCIKHTMGHQLDERITSALIDSHKAFEVIEKPTFGTLCWVNYDMYDDVIDIVGTCTDICVVSNALILKAAFPDATVRVVASACAGTSPKAHEAALDVMRSCQIHII